MLSVKKFSVPSHPGFSCTHLKAVAAEAEADVRTPVNFCVLIDTSGSMELEGKLTNVCKSLYHLVDYMNDSDMISIITFSDSARIHCKGVAMNSSNKQMIRHILSQLAANGSTNMSDALIKARECIIPGATDKKQGILLLTDGHANLGVTQPSGILHVLESITNDFTGCTVSSVGYGCDHNAELLDSMSRKGSGSYAVVNTIEEVGTVFGTILGDMASCVAQNIKATFPAGVTLHTKYSTEVNADGSVTVMVGDLSSGCDATILSEDTGIAVNVSGFNIISNSPFSVEADHSVDSGDEVTGMTTYYRSAVVELIQEVNASTIEMADAMKAKIKAIRREIKAEKLRNENPIWDILLEDLSLCKQTLTMAPWMRAMHGQVLTQHGNYLGMMRGTRAVSGGVTGIPPAAQNMFSSPLSRHISGGVSQAVSGGSPDDAHDPAPPSHDFSGINFNYMTPTRQMAGGAAVPPPTPMRQPFGGSISRATAGSW
jgi:hypothetical protein